MSVQNTPAKVKLPAFSGLNFEESWTTKLQAGWSFHRIDLITNLKSAKSISKIKIDIGGADVLSITGERLRQLNALYGDHTEQGRFVLDLSNFRYRTIKGIYQTMLATTLTQDVTLTVEFGKRDTSAGDPEKPVMRATSYITKTDALGAVFMPFKKELSQMTAGAGDHVYDYPNGAANVFLQRLIFDENEVKISRILVKRGGNTIHTYEREDLDFDLQELAGLKLQDGICVLDFTLFGFGSDGALPTQGLSFEFMVDGKGSIKTYVEGFEQKKLIRPAA